MKPKDISICPDEDCPCCKLDRKIMDLIEASGVDNALASVALTHALARTAYAETGGTTEDISVQHGMFFAKEMVRSLSRLAANDHTEH